MGFLIIIGNVNIVMVYFVKSKVVLFVLINRKVSMCYICLILIDEDFFFLL